jgi:hypothetical protein
LTAVYGRIAFSLNRRFLFLDNSGASTSSGSSPLMDRRGLPLPAGAAASDFNAHPSTLKKDGGRSDPPPAGAVARTGCRSWQGRPPKALGQSRLAAARSDKAALSDGAFCHAPCKSCQGARQKPSLAALDITNIMSTLAQGPGRPGSVLRTGLCAAAPVRPQGLPKKGMLSDLIGCAVAKSCAIDTVGGITPGYDLIGS